MNHKMFRNGSIFPHPLDDVCPSPPSALIPHALSPHDLLLCWGKLSFPWDTLSRQSSPPRSPLLLVRAPASCQFPSFLSFLAMLAFSYGSCLSRISVLWDKAAARRCNELMGSPDIRVIQTAWGLTDSPFVRWMTARFLPFLRITKPLAYRRRIQLSKQFVHFPSSHTIKLFLLLSDQLILFWVFVICVI